jgi:hypothetical protein
MTPDAIKAALAAAGAELAAQQHEDMEYRQAAAVTVMAFLRAFGWPCLATAIEEAARDA